MAGLFGFVLAGLAGCDLTDGRPVEGALAAGLDRAYLAAVAETPFENGPLKVVTGEGGRLGTYTLVPCRGGAAICADGPAGPAGRLRITPDHRIVEGLFRGRTFFLAPGGSGSVQIGRGPFLPLAWNSIPD